MRYNFITIEGNIGAGKTTLSTMLSKHLGAQLILEEFADNPFLPKFYQNPEQYAFPLELFFMAERYKQLKELISTTNLFETCTVSDYLFQKCLLFAKVTLQDEEFRLFQKLFDIINPQISQPDLIIYLHCPIQKLQKNIQQRNRSYEQQIPNDYLFKLQETYTQYLKQHQLRSLIIDTSNVDFVENPKHFENLISALDKEYDYGQHYISVE